MRKIILSITLCLCMALTLLPTAALAAGSYENWETALDAGGLTKGDSIRIGETDYSYKSDVSVTGLDLSSDPPTDNTIYKADTGYVLWEPTTKILTLKDASIVVTTESSSTSASAIILPDGVNVVFEGENRVEANNNTSAFAVYTNGTVSLELTAGSKTTLVAKDGTRPSKSAYGIMVTGSGSVTVTGSGSLTMSANGWNITTYAICTSDDQVNIGGGTLDINGEVYGNIVTIAADTTVNVTGDALFVGAFTNNGRIIVSSGKTLNLSHANSVANNGAIENNGTIKLPSSFTAATIPAGITGNGVVTIGTTSYIKINGEWVVYGGDVTDTWLDISSRPSVVTTYKAGIGYITFAPAVGETPATLTLNNATVAPSLGNDAPSTTALALGDDPIKLVLEGSSYLQGFESEAICKNMSGGEACGDVTIGGTGSLTLSGSYSNYGSFYAGSLTMTDSATVTSSRGTVTGGVTVNPGATLTAVLKVGYPSQRTVYGSITISESEQSSYSSPLAWADGSGMDVNGLLTLAKGTSVADITNHITGSGIVRIVTEVDMENRPIAWEAYYTDGTPVLHRSNALNFTLGEEAGGAGI